MYDIAIIGAGPAGASAAIFSAKAGKKTLVIDNDKGMTRRAWVENHYGIMEISGPDLIEKGKEQAKKFGAEIVDTEASRLEKAGDVIRIHTEHETYEAKHVIVATGASAALAEQSGLQTKAASEPRIKTVLDVDASGRTNIEGIWGAGTVADQSVHTIVTSGDGAKVAINVISELNGERYVDHDLLK